jgi:hypothetical protein
MKKWIPIFKAGIHKDASGHEALWTAEDLDKIAAYNPSHHEAPVVIGHPKDNSPAWGWVEAVKREGDILLATFKDLIPEFKDMVSKGLFKKRSISLYPDGTLRHIGYLGATPPAVKGLEDVAFNEGDQTIIEFNEEGGSMIEEIKKILSEMMAQIKGLMPEKQTTEGGITEMTEQEIQKKINDGISAALKKKDAEFAEAAKTKETEFSEKEASLKKREDALKSEETARKKKAISDFCEGLKKEGKLIPAMEKLGMGITEFMSQIATNETTIEFGEGDKKAKQTPLEFMQSFLSALPKMIEFGEVAGRGTDPGAGGAAEKREKLISNFMENNKDANYTTAVKMVAKEHPDLFKREED